MHTHNRTYMANFNSGGCTNQMRVLIWVLHIYVCGMEYEFCFVIFSVDFPFRKSTKPISKEAHESKLYIFQYF